MTDHSLGLSGLDLNNPSDDVTVLWEEVLANVVPFYPPAAVLVDGQNILINDQGGALFDTLREHAPHWYQVASGAYIAMYAWHGTMNARPLLPSLTNTVIRGAYDSLCAVHSGWNVENVLIQVDDQVHVTSFENTAFMDALKKTVVAAQATFYARTLQVVRYLLLPSNSVPWQHPGIIPGQTLATPEQIDYVNSLVTWSPQSGYHLWHDFRPNEDGVMTWCWFDRNSLKYLMNAVHFAVGSPGYLYIQELYTNLEMGGEEWGPLTTATFHSTTWILAAIHIYLWADVLGNKRFSTERFTTNRRDAMLEQQDKISILLRQILRRRVPGLPAEHSEAAYFALHRFMHTNPNLLFMV